LSIAVLAVVLPRAVASSGVGSQDQLAALQMLQRIQAEATSSSRLMETASWLADVFGPRLANSPSYDASVEWARHRLETFGVEAAVEPYGEFGVTWRNEYTSVHMLQPRYMSVIAYPNTWSSGLEGRTRAPAVHVDYPALASIADLEPYRGQLDGAVVLVAPLQLIELQFEAPAERLSDASLAELSSTSSSIRGPWRWLLRMGAKATATSWSTKSRVGHGSRLPISTRRSWCWRQSTTTVWFASSTRESRLSSSSTCVSPSTSSRVKIPT
jgi:hypothetical protein